MGEKEAIARIEKYAQAHLDRAQTLWAGASKAALAWTIALLLLWTQRLEPKLSQVRVAQKSAIAYHGFTPVAQGINKPEYVVAQRTYQTDLEAVRDPTVELPLSIKLDVPPEWLAPLWLGLAFGLAWYLFQTRRQVFSLTARGLKLFREAQSTPAFVRATVGQTPWWLSPPPSESGKNVNTEEFKRALRMIGRSQKYATILVVGCAIALISIEVRVFYVGFCITSSVLADPRLPDTVGNPTKWLLLSSLDVLLFCIFLLTLWRWFSPSRVKDELEDADKIAGHRRIFLGSALKVLAAGLLAIPISTLGFSMYDNHGHSLSRKRTIRGRRTANRKSNAVASHPELPEGLYKNPTSGTIHTATASCRRCMNGVNPTKLIRIDADAVPWTASYAYTLDPSRAFGIRQPPEGPTRTDAEERLAMESGPRAQSSTPHLHWRHRSVLIEQHAIALIQQGQSSEACRMLANSLSGHLTSKADLRLYDLLAGLSVRTKQTGEMSSLIKAAKSVEQDLHRFNTTKQPNQHGPVMSFLYRVAGNRITAPRERQVPHPKRSKPATTSTSRTLHTEYLETLIAVRIKKWQDPRSAWYRRWSDPSKKVRWSWSNKEPGPAGSIEIG